MEGGGSIKILSLEESLEVGDTLKEEEPMWKPEVRYLNNFKGGDEALPSITQVETVEDFERLATKGFAEEQVLDDKIYFKAETSRERLLAMMSEKELEIIKEEEEEEVEEGELLELRVFDFSKTENIPEDAEIIADFSYRGLTSDNFWELYSTQKPYMDAVSSLIQYVDLRGNLLSNCPEIGYECVI